MHMAQQYSVERGETKLGRHERLPASEPRSSSSGGKASASFCLGWSLDSHPSCVVFSSLTNGEADLAKDADADRAMNGEAERRDAGVRTVDRVDMERRGAGDLTVGRVDVMSKTVAAKNTKVSQSHTTMASVVHKQP